MTQVSARSISVDSRGDSRLCVELTSESGRIVVRRLAEGLDDVLFSFTDCRYTMVIPDDLAALKTVRLPAQLNLQTEEVGQWELNQRLLEPAELFQTVLTSTSLDYRMLGVVWRRRRLEEWTDQLTSRKEKPTGLRYASRAVSIGRGFARFCRIPDGDLLALVDIMSNRADICFMYQRQPFDVATIELPVPVGFDQAGLERLGVELKTVINLKLASFAEWGVSLPLAGLVVFGERVDGRVRTALTELFPAGVRQPDFHEGYFSELADRAVTDRALYLAALGAAVNSLA